VSRIAPHVLATRTHTTWPEINAFYITASYDAPSIGRLLYWSMAWSAWPATPTTTYRGVLPSPWVTAAPPATVTGLFNQKTGLFHATPGALGISGLQLKYRFHIVAVIVYNLNAIHPIFDS
jgi:hypothetical protein